MTMQELKEELKEELKKLVAELPAIVEDTILAAGHVPEHPQAQFYTTTQPGQLRVDLPRTTTLVAEYLRLVSAQGSWSSMKVAWAWACERGNGDIYYHFKHRHGLGVFLAVCFDAGCEGATCRRVQTGVEEVPVYEVICDDHEEPGDVSDTV